MITSRLARRSMLFVGAAFLFASNAFSQSAPPSQPPAAPPSDAPAAQQAPTAPPAEAPVDLDESDADDAAPATAPVEPATVATTAPAQPGATTTAAPTVTTTTTPSGATQIHIVLYGPNAPTATAPTVAAATTNKPNMPLAAPMQQPAATAFAPSTGAFYGEPGTGYYAPIAPISSPHAGYYAAAPRYIVLGYRGFGWRHRR